ncbi:DUF2934 domain-containing protein [Agrobacterium rhizogenes]|nr:DUF2934 domain-containing protein [Rhizobium rhizogenes]NTJ79124.1 DUF2934 domain-containing protein [Rhizobium rhizogenes]
MNNDENENEDKRRERAHRIWEEEGRPEGRHLDHWQRAEEQHERTEQEAESPTGQESGDPTARDHEQTGAASAKASKSVRE